MVIVQFLQLALNTQIYNICQNQKIPNRKYGPGRFGGVAGSLVFSQ